MGRVDPGESCLQSFLCNPKYSLTFSRILATSIQMLEEVNMIPTHWVLKLKLLDWLFPFLKSQNFSPLFEFTNTKMESPIE